METKSKTRKFKRPHFTDPPMFDGKIYANDVLDSMDNPRLKVAASMFAYIVGTEITPREINDVMAGLMQEIASVHNDRERMLPTQWEVVECQCPDDMQHNEYGFSYKFRFTNRDCFTEQLIQN